MRATHILMGMPITVEILGHAQAGLMENVFDYFGAVDRRFSTYRADSEIASINRQYLAEADYSSEMREVLDLAERTRLESHGYFDIRRPDGTLDPSGVVKGWAIRNAADLVTAGGVSNFFIEAGGDIQAGGVNGWGEDWRVGIRNPFRPDEIIKVIVPRGRGVATSGTYARGQHIYDPHDPRREITDVVSVTVIGKDVLEADRFATAAFAMGKAGIHFIERTPELEGYIVDSGGRATMTSGFTEFVV